MSQTDSDLSFLYMPLDTVAAYWLSLRKVLGNSKNLKALETEAGHVSEPFARHLLSLILSDAPPARTRKYAEICASNELIRLERQFDLMRTSVLDIAMGENPLRTLAKFVAHFPSPISTPDILLETAQARLADTQTNKAPQEAFKLDHDMPYEAMIITLLFYVTLGRRHGKEACRNFLELTGSMFFSEALSLVLDGFDTPFVRKWMKEYKLTLLNDMRLKLSMSIDLCFSIQNRIPFEDMHLLVRSYLR